MTRADQRMRPDTLNAEKSFCYMDTPIGKVVIAEDGTGISDLFFVPYSMPPGATERDTSLLARAKTQLGEYFQGARYAFDLPLALSGTPFQMAGWQVLLAIPYGETRSYKQIAELIGKPKAYRAVGLANNRNPVSIVVPCHRVIGHNGDLRGYGSGVHKKDFLLKFERKNRYDREIGLKAFRDGAIEDAELITL